MTKSIIDALLKINFKPNRKLKNSTFSERISTIRSYKKLREQRGKYGRNGN